MNLKQFNIAHFWYWLTVAKKSGMLPTKEDERDYKLENKLGWGFGTAYVPKHDSWVVNTKDIKNQKNLNTCVFNASTCQKEVQENIILSVRSLVSKAKQLALLQGNGFADIRNGAQTCVKWGIVEQSLVDEQNDPQTLDWNSYSALVTASLDTNATTHKTKSFWFVGARLDRIKLLDDGNALITGIDWYTGYNQGGGFSYPWIISRTSGYKVGGHCITMIGYDMNYNGHRVYVFQNSYGDNWGDSGKFYIDMDFFDNSNYGVIAILDMDMEATDLVRQYEFRNVKGDKSNAIYFISGGEKHGFPSWDCFMAYADNKTDFITLRQVDIDKVPEGAPMKIEESQHWSYIKNLKRPIKYGINLKSMSDMFAVNYKDVIKGIVTAMISAALSYVYQLATTGSFNVNWHTVLQISVTAGLGYIVKNFFTSKDSTEIAGLKIK